MIENSFLDSLTRHSPALVVALPLLLAFSTPLWSRLSTQLRNVWVVVGMCLTTLLGLFMAWQVLAGGPIVYVFGAADPVKTIPFDSGGIPVRIIFNVDAMSAFMVVITSIVGLATTVYARPSELRRKGLNSFYALLMLLIAGVMGLVCTGDLFNMFVFFEISSLAGAALVAYRIDKGISVEAGLKYALISTVGGLFFLIAVALLYGQYGSLNIGVIADMIQKSHELTRLDRFALVFIIVPLAMKAGAVPMHMWTPDAYSRAPSSITAFLVVSSQASLYALFRILFTLYNVTLDCRTFGWIIIILGVLSMFIGVTMALPQKTVKRLMAYHAVSQTGYMLLGVGVGLATLCDRGDGGLFEICGKTAMVGGIFHIINHAMYKGLLFLTAGAVIHRTGVRNLEELGGLGHTMKFTMIFFIIGALSIAGIPPFNGFASKILIYESVFKFNPFLAIIAILVSILTLASFVKVFHSMFMGPKLPRYAEVKDAPAPMMFGMGLLTVMILIGSLFPGVVTEYIVEPAVNALANQGTYINTIMYP